MHCGILDWILDQKKKKLEGTTGEKGKVCDEKAALYQC